MNNMPNLTPAQQQALLKMASEKLGMDQSKIEAAIRSGNAGALGNRAGIQIEKYLNDPKAVERILSDPQAQAMIKKMIGGG